MYKILICIIIACIATVAFIFKSKQVENEILVMPVDLSKNGTYSGMLDCKISCALRFNIYLDPPVKYSEEFQKQLEECDIWLEILMDGTLTKKRFIRLMSIYSCGCCKFSVSNILHPCIHERFSVQVRFYG